MKTKLLPLASLTLSILFSHANANTVLIGTQSDAQGIYGLTVGGVTYDVDFLHGSYEGLFGAVPTQITNSATAGEIAVAVAGSLNSFGVTQLTGTTPGFQDLELAYLYGTTCGQTLCVAATELNPPSTVWTSDGGVGGSASASTVYSFVDFMSVTPVPLPATTWLTLSGLGGLVAFVRKKRASSFPF